MLKDLLRGRSITPAYSKSEPLEDLSVLENTRVYLCLLSDSTRVRTHFRCDIHVTYFVMRLK